MAKSNGSIRRARLLALALALLAMTPWQVIAAPPDAGVTERRTEAGLHFDAGLELYDKGAWAAALAEFLEARRLYPLRNATNNAAVCLEKLGRYDEALDLFDALLREFGEAMPAGEKERVQRKVTVLRGLVGTIEIEGAEPGAAIVIDGRERGAFPALAPLRVGAGSHVVRVAREGFLPFETRVEVVGGQLARVKAPLRAITKPGRLSAGEHQIKVAAPGFSPSSQQLSRRPRFIAEIGTAVSYAGSFGGEIVGRCVGACSASIGVLGEGILHGGYELGSGLGFGLAAGYLTVTKAVTGRATTLQPVWLATQDFGVVDDLLRLRGALLGTWVGWSIKTPIPIHFRLGGGVLLGSIEDARAGKFAPNGRRLVHNGDHCVARSTTATDVPCFHVGTVVEAHSTRLLYLAPEVRVGLPLSRHVEVNLGVELPILISLSRLRWGASSSGGSPHLINAGPNGVGEFAKETLVSGALVLFAPGVGVRYDF